MHKNSNVYIKKLIKERPSFHGRDMAGSKNYSIKPKVLYEITNIMHSNSRTLETGCGYTTVVFAILSSHHTVISPFPQEHILIKSWCKKNGISIDNIDFKPFASQEIICSLNNDPLDIVLVDGDHAFPTPFIDWYYSADRIVKGGFFILDDIQIPTCKVLYNFLKMEKARWVLYKKIGKTVFFKKIDNGSVASKILWTDQPYNLTIKSRISLLISKIRHLIR